MSRYGRRALASIFSCGKAFANSPRVEVTAGEALSPELAKDVDERWSLATGREFPLHLPVFFLSGTQCCVVLVKSLDMRVEELMEEIEKGCNIPSNEQQLLFPATLSIIEGGSRLRHYAELLAQAGFLQLIRREPEEVRRYVEQLNDEDAFIRIAAAADLGKLGPHFALPALEEALQSNSDWIVRMKAAMMIGKFGKAAEPCIPTLEFVMRSDEHTNVRMHAAIALREIGSPAIPALERALSDDDEIVCFRAAEALGKLGNMVAIPALERAASHDSTLVRTCAAQAVTSILNISKHTQDRYTHPSIDEKIRAHADALKCIVNTSAVPGFLHGAYIPGDMAFRDHSTRRAVPQKRPRISVLRGQI